MKELDKPILLVAVAALMAVTLIGAQLGASYTKHATTAATTVASFPAPLAQRIPDPQTRNQIQHMVAFAEGRSALARHDLATAARRADELPFSLKHALLLLALASQQCGGGDTQAAALNIRRALAEAGPVAQGQRIRLLAMAARIYLTFDAVAGQVALNQAVRAWRSALPDVRGAASGNVGATSESFYEVVRAADGHAQVFSLDLPGLPKAGLNELALAYLPLKPGLR